MLRKIANWLFGTTAAPAPAPEADGRRMLAFSTDSMSPAPLALAMLDARLRAARPQRVASAPGAAMDGLPETVLFQGAGTQTIGDLMFSWFASQAFIGYQACAIIAQHWLVDKACWMPGRDAIRQGFTFKIDGLPEDGAVEETKAINKALKRHQINLQMQEYIGRGRTFGIRLALFKVESTDPKYYERPFNIDAVEPGSFKGVVQIDPYWVTPEMNYAAVADPTSPDFYEPTWWTISGKRYHRSHFRIFRTSPVADMLKPSYQYGGVSVPQQVMERVYAADRTANEGPQLAMTKRLTVFKTDLAKAYANQANFLTHLQNWVFFRDNHQIKVADTKDAIEQIDTSLADLDEVIMTQYQLVAAAAKVPATKLMGTTPKGFNSTGEYEESSYHEELETIQENDLTPFLDRYFEIVLRSDIEPKMGHAKGSLHAVIAWEPLDSPTAKEEAEINKAKAETDSILIGTGAIDGMDVRNRLRTEKDSGYTGLTLEPLVQMDPLEAATADLLGDAEDPLDAATAALGAGGGDPLADATAALTGGEAPNLEAATAALTGDSFEIPTAAGVILTRLDGRSLFVKRGRGGDHPDTWAWPGGSIEDGETPEAAARREVFEETGIALTGFLVPVGATNGFVAFAAGVGLDVEVTLNHEHTEYVWASLDDPPKPLHPGVKALLKNGR